MHFSMWVFLGLVGGRMHALFHVIFSRSGGREGGGHFINNPRLHFIKVS